MADDRDTQDASRAIRAMTSSDGWRVLSALLDTMIEQTKLDAIQDMSADRQYLRGKFEALTDLKQTVREYEDYTIPSKSTEEEEELASDMFPHRPGVGGGHLS